MPESIPDALSPWAGDAGAAGREAANAMLDDDIGDRVP